LVKPWGNSDRVVVGDSYFASVPAALRLKAMGLRFIGVVKTATSGFPSKFLGEVHLPKGKGDMKGLLHKDPESGTTLLAFTWVDRDRRNFIASCSSLSPGKMVDRDRWRQRDKLPDAEPTKLKILIPQPKCAEVYYKGNARIDQHNRVRQAGLNLEKKIATMDLSKRASISLFGMMVVDAYQLALGCQGRNNGNHTCEPRQFFETLAAELIENDYDRRALRKRQDREDGDEPRAEKRPVIVLEASKHLTAPTPTKRRKKSNHRHREQGRCMVCRVSSSDVCRECQSRHQLRKDRQYWICNKPGKACMGVHILKEHPDKVGY
jgi:hypothetical protein